MILQKLAHIACIRRNEDGSMVIETAFVAPVLMMLALGGFEISAIVARQTELQSAAAEAASVVRAVIPEDAAARNTVRDVVATSTGLTNQQVTVTEIYRCGTTTTYSNTADNCGTDTEYKFIQVNITDTYQPIWTKFGVGSALDYNISRTVQIG